MAIIRNSSQDYIILNRKILENPNLSWGAKGLYGYISCESKRFTAMNIYEQNYVNELLKAGIITIDEE